MAAAQPDAADGKWPLHVRAFAARDALVLWSRWSPASFSWLGTRSAQAHWMLFKLVICALAITYTETFRAMAGVAADTRNDLAVVRKPSSRPLRARPAGAARGRTLAV